MGTRNTFRYFVRSFSTSRGEVYTSIFSVSSLYAWHVPPPRPARGKTSKGHNKTKTKPCRRFCPTTCKANRRQQTVADATLPDRTAANGGLGWGPAPSKGNTRHVEQPLLLFSFRFDSGSLLLVLARAREFIRERPRRPHDELKRVGCES